MIINKMENEDLSADEIIAINKYSYSNAMPVWHGNIEGNFNHAVHGLCRKLFIEKLPGRKILEAGCGLGIDSMKFYDNGYDVCATDFVMDSLKHIKILKPGIKTVLMDMTNQCFRENFFDGVYIFAGFLHIPSKKSLSTLRGFNNILKPGGVIFLHHVKSTLGFTEYIVDNLLIKNNPAYCFCHDEEKISDLLEKADFVNPRFTKYGSFSKLNQDKNPVSSRYGLVPYQVMAVKK
jgi:ubiquinone/menaquinone biosynthesis C-methylase UbiE